MSYSFLEVTESHDLCTRLQREHSEGGGGTGAELKSLRSTNADLTLRMREANDKEAMAEAHAARLAEQLDSAQRAAASAAASPVLEQQLKEARCVLMSTKD